MFLRALATSLAMLVLVGCLGGSGPADADLAAWLDDGCDEVLQWARERPVLPEAPPTLGGLAPGPVVAYTDELAAGADSLTLRLRALGPPGNEAADHLYDDLLASLAEVSTGASSVADEYRSEAAIPLNELTPLLREATDLSVGVSTAFRAFSRDPEVGPIVVEIPSCEAVSAIIG